MADAPRSSRPPTDPTLAARLREQVGRLTREVVTAVPDGRRVWLNKTALAALSCDGRYLDHVDTPFTWSTATAAGQLAHAAVEIDIVGGRRRTVNEIVQFAWNDLTARATSAGRYLGGLTGVESDALRAETRSRCLAFRDTFPQLPPWMHPRAEVALTWRLSPGVIVKGVPDLVVGRPHPERRLMQLVELKTGSRFSSHRDDLHLYALLATVKYGVAPFRVATYYLDEADWEREDVTPELLESAASVLAGKIIRAVELTLSPPADNDLRLRSGPACNWCNRAPTCPLATRPSSLELVAA